MQMRRGRASRISYITNDVSLSDGLSGLDLEAGQHLDLTGRENVFLMGALLGLSRREIRRRFDEIIGFAEGEAFIDTPLRSYSTGMRVRLGFSVAVHVDAGILLVDEVLAVGDQSFQEKCLRKIRQLQEEGRTILFVSHALELVRMVCGRSLWLDGGALRADGPADQVVSAYADEDRR